MRVMTSKYEISSKNHICSVQTFSFRGIIYLPEKKFIGTSSILTWDKSSLLPTDFVFTLEWFFSLSFNSCIYLRSKIYHLIWLFITIVKSTGWSVNLSRSHSYFSFGIICSSFWRSFVVSLWLLGSKYLSILETKWSNWGSFVVHLRCLCFNIVSVLLPTNNIQHRCFNACFPSSGGSHAVLIHAVFFDFSPEILYLIFNFVSVFYARNTLVSLFFSWILSGFNTERHFIW